MFSLIQKPRQTFIVTLPERFLFSASQVSRGKPHSDVFLFAANSMGYRSERLHYYRRLPQPVYKTGDQEVFGYCSDSFKSKFELSGAGAQVVFSREELLSYVWNYEP
ncbi:MAG: hypothetical protein V7776_02855 [Halopseudomonas aestusnigri]